VDTLFWRYPKIIVLLVPLLLLSTISTDDTLVLPLL
jgi:hypothetical protein